MAAFLAKIPLKRVKAKVTPEAIPFQTGIGPVLETDPPAAMMATYYLIVAMLVAVVVVASVADTDIVVVGSGRLTTDTPPIQLQPVDRAIIREMKVKPGDVVKRGQVLATFDPTFARADLSSLLVQQQALLAQLRRLESEVEGSDFVADASANADERLQSTLLQQRRSQYKSRVRMYDEEIQGLQAAIRTTEDNRAHQAKLMEINRDIESKRRDLAKTGTGTNLQYQESQASSIRTEQDYRASVNRLVELQHTLLSKKADRQNYIDDWLRQVLDSLVSTRTELAKVDEAVTKARRITEFEVLTAPEDGVVLDVAKRSPGAVLPGAELLITIVPADAVFVGEINVPSRDIGYVKVGDKVVIKIDAFPYQRHGMLEGRLRFISQESYGGGNESPNNKESMIGTKDTKTAGGATHVGRVELLSTKLYNLPEGIRLIRGMTLNAEIKVGTRSIAAYVLNPITRSFNESLREP
ncbi:MAG: HlyD family type I secretion periplasmic adaptor subunit [Magnetococcales bacterium]|nr:HlyD family type I secretion periplasmic adaptor subunit [Magnetococcales bacterium]MBF0115914.1 HlyD family type I secretion periplasmic adaptor subunit [Magnetococcales bacterium]